MKKILLSILILAIVFIVGCGIGVPVEEVKEEVPIIEEPEPVNDEPEEAKLEGSLAMVGKACKKSADCGEAVNLGEPYCLGRNEYQEVARPKCTFETGGSGNLACTTEKVDVRLGLCPA